MTHEWADLRKTEIPLYDGVAPGSEGWTQHEQEGVTDFGLHVVRNVTRPTLTPFLLGVPVSPADDRGLPAVVIAPGGAWHFLAWDHEGIQVARWLNDRGIAAFILKYRLVATDDTFPADMEGRDVWAVSQPLMPLISADAQNAIRLVRRRAVEWGIDPHKVGIMGFSAGGTVTSLATLQYDESSRPNFAAPIYGAGAPGDVPPDAPPLFLVVADDDGLSPHTLNMYQRWHDAGKEVELHVYSRGGHGFGMNHTGLPAQGWIDRLLEWLIMLGMEPR